MAITGTTNIRTSAVLQDSVYEHRWYDALGPYVVKVIEEFVNWPKNAAGYGAACTTTPTGAGTAVLVPDGAALGGRMIITNAAANDDSVEMQWLGEAFLPTATNRIYFGIKFQISDATQSDFLVGLAITDTAAIDDLTDGIYFRKLDGVTACNFVLEGNAGTETETAALTVVAATDYILEWTWNGSNIEFYVDGVLIGAPVLTNLPVTYLTPTIAFQNGEGVAKNMTVDWMRCIQVPGY